MAESISENSPRPTESFPTLQIPSKVQKKINADQELGNADYADIHIKNTHFLNQRMFRCLKRTLASSEKIEEWAGKGRDLYKGEKLHNASLDPTAHAHETESAKGVGNKRFSTTSKSSSETSQTQSIEQQERAHKAEFQLMLQKKKNAPIVEKLFPTADLAALSLSELKTLKGLVEEVRKKDDSPVEKKLLMSVVKRQADGKIPSSPSHLIDEFQKLNAFRQEVGDLAFVACNWKGKDDKGITSTKTPIDDSFIANLKKNLKDEGWANSLYQLESLVSDNSKENLNLFLSNLLGSDEIKGRSSFNPENEKEKAILELISASEDFPGLCSQFMDRIHNSPTSKKDDSLPPPSLAATASQLISEIKRQTIQDELLEFKEHFDPSIHPMINDYFNKNFPTTPDEIPKPQAFISLLFQDQMKDIQHQKVFTEAFTPLLPTDPSQLTPQIILTFRRTAKLGGELVEKHQYNPLEVAKGCLSIFAAQQQRNELLRAPANAQTLNNLLLGVLPAKKDWGDTLKTEISSITSKNFPNHLASVLTRILELDGNQHLEPRNQQEIEAILDLIGIGEAIKDDHKYPPEAISKGIIDYLTEQRTNKEPLSVPMFGSSDKLISFCQQHLKSINGWEDALKARVPTDQQEFCEIFNIEIKKHPNLGPINQEELEALDHLVELGFEIAQSKDNAYDKESIAQACADYLVKMRADRRSFTELSPGFLGLTAIPPTDLYPLCLANFIRNSVGDHPDNQQIVSLILQTVKDKSTPLTEQGKQTLENLIASVSSKEFAQGKGIRHPAVASKFSTILSDLKLSSVAQLNSSNIPPDRFQTLFNYVQHEEFDYLPSVNDIIDEIRKNPLKAVQVLSSKMTQSLMGMGKIVENPTKHLQKIEKTSDNVEELISNLMSENLKGSLEVVQAQLNKLVNALNITESASINVSINTVGVTSALKKEAESILAHSKSFKKISNSLQEIEKQLAQDEDVKKYTSLSSKNRSEEEQKIFEELRGQAAVTNYLTFQAFAKATLTSSDVAHQQELLGNIIEVVQEHIQPSSEKQSVEDTSLKTASKTKRRFFSKIKKQPTASTNTSGSLKILQDNLNILTEEYQKLQPFNFDDLDKMGVMGTAIQESLKSLKQIQEQRQAGTYENEDLLKGLSAMFSIINPSGKNAVSKTAVGLGMKVATKVLSSSSGVESSIYVATKLSMRKAKKSLEKAKKENNTEDIEKYTAQLLLLKTVQVNRSKIASVTAPIFAELKKNHNLEKYKPLLNELAAIVADPNYVLDEQAQLSLATLMAGAAETFLTEVQTNYPKFFENLAEGVFSLPKQAKTASEPLSIWSTEKRTVSEKDQKAAAASKSRLEAFLVKERPLKAEAEQEAKKQESSATNWFSKGWNQFTSAVSDSIADYDHNQKVRTLGTALQVELENHPFLIQNFDDNQLKETHHLMEEAVKFQNTHSFPPEVVATACRLFIEKEVDSNGKLDIPLLSLTDHSTEEKLAKYCFLATIEHTIRDADLKHGSDPYFIASVTSLIAQQITPLTLPLTPLGQENLRQLTNVIIDPKFADGKPVVLPFVQAQFKNMFPSEFNTVNALNTQKLSTSSEKLFLKKSRLLMKREINLGKLQEQVTQYPAKAASFLAYPFLDNLAENKATANEMRQAVDSLADQLEKSDVMGFLKLKLNSFLEKAGALNAVQVELNVSTRQLASQVRKENDNLRDFIKQEGRLPQTVVAEQVTEAKKAKKEQITEAETLGITTPFLCKAVQFISQAKDTQNKTSGGLFSDIHTGLTYFKPIIRMASDNPLLQSMVKTFLPSIVERVLEHQVDTLSNKTVLTESEEQQLELLKFLLKEENLKNLTFLLTQITVSVLKRHDFTKYEPLIDLFIKITDPNSKDGVNEIELAETLMNATDLFTNEVEEHYSDLLPDLLNMLKSMQFLSVDKETAST